jgi:predicted transcriptional regulator
MQTSGPDDDIVEAARKMDEWSIRRLPVVSSDGVLMGVVRESDLRRALRKMEGATSRLPIAARALRSEVMRPCLTNFDRGRDRTILQSSNQEIPLIRRTENTHGQPPQTSREVEKGERERTATGGYGAAR